MSAFLIWNSAHLTEDHSLMDLEFARSMAATCCLLVKMENERAGGEQGGGESHGKNRPGQHEL